MNSPLTSVSPQAPPFTGYGFESGRFFPQQPTPPDEIFDDENQVPSPEEFEAIVEDYLNNLSPKKRDKALVDQERYQLIQQVLRDPRNTSISTAQFRFWVKKMFQLQPGSVDLVCHDSKPVAMREQIYPILVRAHREAHHGGRDKTSALVRRRYSWIPKELVARFVRQCPFCITRRNGGQSPGVFASKALRHNVNRHSFCGFDTAPPLLCTPQLQEDSDISTSSGPPSADHGFDASPQYLSSSPRRGSIFYDREEDLLQSYQYSTRSSTDTTTIHPSLMTGLRQTDPIQSAPQSPMYYSAAAAHPGYLGYYYPNMLGIAPCENSNNSTHHHHNTSAHVHPFLRPDATDILAHQDDQSTAPYFTATNNTTTAAANSATQNVNHFSYDAGTTHGNAAFDL